MQAEAEAEGGMLGSVLVSQCGRIAEIPTTHRWTGLPLKAQQASELEALLG